MNKCEINLGFISNPRLELVDCVFSCSLLPSHIMSVRGKTSGAFKGRASFQWTASVQAICVLLLRNCSYANRGAHGQAPIISGNGGSLAASLDNALYKQPRWMNEVFGCDSLGTCLLSRMVRRTNPARKRPGPVIISLNDSFLNPRNIKVTCDGKLVTDSRILDQLASAIEEAFLAEVTTKPIGKPNGVIVPFPKRENQAITDGDENTKEGLMDCLTSLTINNAGALLSFNVPYYLKSIRTEIALLEENLDQNATIIDYLKKQIKEICIASEQYYTRQVAENRQGGRFLYSCSSLLDKGIAEYLNDPGWLLLLRVMGQAKRQYGGTYERVFFLNPKDIPIDSLPMLSSIIMHHATNGVDVRIMNPLSIPDELMPNRNIAWFGGVVLLHASDQIRWDLSATTAPAAISWASQQHQFFQENSIVKFDHSRPDNIKSQLLDLCRANYGVIRSDRRALP